MVPLRHEILNFLAEHPEGYVSGERISQRLNVTRSAIWKQIKILQAEGFNIEAQTKNGYRLLKTPAVLNQWVLQQALTTTSLGRSMELLDVVASTNEWAKEEARRGAAHGHLVIADHQNSGRGRLQREWESPSGGLWLSVVLRPNLSLADASKITLAASIAIVDALMELYQLPAGIKWPNDIIYQGKKLAGILGEVVGEWNAVQTLILGLGLNANFPREQLSEQFSAVTLLEILGEKVNLNSLAAEILKHLEIELKLLENKEFENLRSKWSARAVGIGQEIIVLRGDQELEGKFRGISVDGALILETQKGEKSFTAGEIQLRSKKNDYF